jgi:hypothetical protein
MERPTGVTILAVLGFIGAGMLVLAAILMFIGGAILSNMASYPMFAMLGGIGGAIVGVVFLGFAALYVVTALGLLKLQNWARVLVIVLLGIGVCFYALGLLGALIHFRIFLLIWRAIFAAIDIWIILYLLKPQVKQAFGATSL